ncbi:putative membrane protein [Mycobacteroides abscessus subsp. bolletii 1S-154-0310]|uniref:hypothetical protein n=1 Tax=Mycobacteroides abscessus TaxID=36809 RepID=UPI0002681DE1|nr:hypothetical protein [Mycobacteroides abscessus]EIU64090.1 putative membrane protein [Mycobacteroides abscessus subsp. bolletii 1S-151-0930]EIU69007.1 putative membrane protein [Mycobacteroides abscessus subsp. bolletii 1S-152-0914]EIU81595.1 putative membrane protein [Mycobacteroides abscessus subsp. bolletii 1S-154-0310]MBE5480744.1 hypothetical protein [Mycobacteroides abscessus]MBN7423245.1 hypothetical protein [Mycobacteroides abscessus subsp. massiliense]
MGQTLATTRAAAAVAPLRRASRRVMVFGFLASVLMMFQGAQFPFEQRPAVILLDSAIFTFLTVKLLTSVSAPWRYLLIGEIWLSAVLMIVGISTQVTHVTESALAVAPVTALVIATWNWGVEVVANLRHKGHSYWFLVIVILNASLACVLSLCIALSLKLIDYDNPADMADPALRWLPKVLMALIIAKVAIWLLLARFHPVYEKIDDWIVLAARVMVAYVVPFFAVLFVLGMRPHSGHWPAFVALAVSLIVTAYNSINTHRGPLDPVLVSTTPELSDRTQIPPCELPTVGAEQETPLETIAREAYSYTEARKEFDNHRLRLYQGIRNALEDGHSYGKIAKAAKMKRAEIGNIVANL